MSYTGMSKLAEVFKGQPFTVLAFPCNQFGKQEPKANSWVEDFVRGDGSHHCGLIYCDWKGYFPYPLFAKCNVKADWCTADPAKSCTASSSDCCSTNDRVWQWIEALHPGVTPKWNFAGKNLFDRCGKLAGYVNDETLDPYDLRNNITALLTKPCSSDDPVIKL